MKVSVTILLMLLGSFAASAADFSVVVKDENGAVVENAVVSLEPKFTSNKPMNAGQEVLEMGQRGAMFTPFVLPVHVGTKVSFPNYDEFRHQVYSFSKAKRFELRLYGQDESKSVIFENPGVVALGCNIHDNMLAYIYVSEFPIVAKSGEEGVVTLSGLEAGSYGVHIWHPDMASGEKLVLPEVTLGSESGLLNATVKLRSIRSIQKAPAEGGDY